MKKLTFEVIIIDKNSNRNTCTTINVETKNYFSRRIEHLLLQAGFSNCYLEINLKTDVSENSVLQKVLNEIEEEWIIN